MPSSVPWAPNDAVGSSVAPLLPVDIAVATELKRAKQLAQIRAQFRELCQKSSAVTAPPMHAIERWLLLSKWHEHASSSEPLLPVGKPTAADAALGTDLQRAGMTSHEAQESVAALRASTIAAAAVIRSTAEASGGGAGSSSSSSTGRPRRPLIQSISLGNGLTRLSLQASAPPPPAADDDVSDDQDGESESGCDDGPEAGTDGAVSVEVTDACMEKLRVLFARGRTSTSASAGASAASDADSLDAAFLPRLFVCLLRYKAVGGLGFQAALGGAVFLQLQRQLGTNFEAFASPLNCFFGERSGIRTQLLLCLPRPATDGAQPHLSQGRFARRFLMWTRRLDRSVPSARSDRSAARTRSALASSLRCVSLASPSPL